MAAKKSQDNFKPMGGFPSIIREEDEPISEKTLESRGFATNIVSIGNIMESKKKQDFLSAFGTEEEGTDFELGVMFTDKPNEYSEIIYKEIPKEI